MNYTRDLEKNPYQGVDYGGTKYIPTGFSSDYLTNDLMSRKLTFITSQAEEGKTLIAHRIILNGIDRGKRVLLVDGEYYQEELIHELYLKIIGNDDRLYDKKKVNKLWIKEPKEHILKMIQAWHKEKLYVISKNECDFKNIDELYAEVEKQVVLHDIDLVCYDNMMVIVTSSQAERNAKQADFVKAIIRMNQRKNVHSVIVNHARQQSERGIELDIFSMSGTSDMANMADNVYTLRRNFEPLEGEPDGWLYLKKNKLNGRHKEMQLIFNHENRMYNELDEFGNQIQLSLNWQGKGEQTNGFKDTDRRISTHPDSIRSNNYADD